MLPGVAMAPGLIGGGVAFTPVGSSITMTAGYVPSYQEHGYVASGGPFATGYGDNTPAGSAGSISAEPFSGFTCDYIVCSAVPAYGFSVAVQGTGSSPSITKMRVDGTTIYTLSSWSAGNGDMVATATLSSDIFSGSTYTLEFGN
jgi:hypothetical protein